MCALNYLSV
jgi:hypothetical protein